MQKDCDVLVGGAGIQGVTVACYLQEKGYNVLLVDMGGVASGNTSSSAAMLRNTFTSGVNLALAQSSIEMYKQIQMYTDIGLNNMKYLWLLSQQQYETHGGSILDFEDRGLGVNLLEAKILAEHIPGLILDPASVDEVSAAAGLPAIAHGLLCDNCYSLDPGLLTQFYFNEFLSNGGEYKNAEIKGFVVGASNELAVGEESLPDQPYAFQDKKVNGVVLADGEKISADLVVLATGAWSRDLLYKLGVDAHLQPQKKQIFSLVSERFEDLMNLPCFENGEGTIPFTVLPYHGIYMKPDIKSGGFSVACSNTKSTPFDQNRDVEKEFCANSIKPFIEAYFAQFELASYNGGVAGSYFYHLPTKIPLVDKVRDGLAVVTGASGSGIMKADAIARVAARSLEMILRGRPINGPVTLFDGTRFNVMDLTEEGSKLLVPERFVI